MSSWRYRPTRSPSRISSIGILLTEVLCLVGVFAVAAPHHLESVRQHQAFSISSTQGTTGPRTEHILHASTGCVRLQRPPLNPRVELVEVCEILRRTPFPYSLLPDQQCVAAKASTWSRQDLDTRATLFSGWSTISGQPRRILMLGSRRYERISTRMSWGRPLRRSTSS